MQPLKLRKGWEGPLRHITRRTNTETGSGATLCPGEGLGLPGCRDVLGDLTGSWADSDSGVLQCMDTCEQGEKAAQVHLALPSSLKEMCVPPNTSVVVWDELHSQPLVHGQMVVSATYFKALRVLRCGISCMFYLSQKQSDFGAVVHTGQHNCCQRLFKMLLSPTILLQPFPSGLIKDQWQGSQSQDQSGGERDGVGRTLLPTFPCPTGSGATLP